MFHLSMLHSSERCTPIPSQWELSWAVEHNYLSDLMTWNGHGHEHFNTSAVVQHLIASCHQQPNPLGTKVLIPKSPLLSNWRTVVTNYHDDIVIDFLSYGWPLYYTTPTLLVSSLHNHPYAMNFDSHMQAYIDTELSWNAIAWCFDYPPFSDDFVCTLLQTVPKCGSSMWCVIMDLSFPPGSSVNDGISPDTYLGEHFKLRYLASIV